MSPVYQTAGIILERLLQPGAGLRRDDVAVSQPLNAAFKLDARLFLALHSRVQGAAGVQICVRAGGMNSFGDPERL